MKKKNGITPEILVKRVPLFFCALLSLIKRQTLVQKCRVYEIIFKKTSLPGQVQLPIPVCTVTPFSNTTSVSKTPNGISPRLASAL